MSDSKKWIMPLRNWKLAMNGFVIEFEGRFHGWKNGSYIYFFKVSDFLILTKGKNNDKSPIFDFTFVSFNY